MGKRGRPQGENTGQRRRNVVAGTKLKQRGPANGNPGNPPKPTIQGQGNAIVRRLAKALKDPEAKRAVLEVRKEGLGVRALQGMLTVLMLQMEEAFLEGRLDEVEYGAIQRANFDVGRKLLAVERDNAAAVYQQPAVLAIQVNVDTDDDDKLGMGSVLEIG